MRHEIMKTTGFLSTLMKQLHDDVTDKDAQRTLVALSEYGRLYSSSL